MTEKEVYWLQFPKEAHGKTFGKDRDPKSPNFGKPRVIGPEPFKETNLAMAMQALEDGAVEVEAPGAKPAAKDTKGGSS